MAEERYGKEYRERLYRKYSPDRERRARQAFRGRGATWGVEQSEVDRELNELQRDIDIEADRLLNAAEDVERGRQFQAEEAEKGRQFQAQQARETREHNERFYRDYYDRYGRGSMSAEAQPTGKKGEYDVPGFDYKMDFADAQEALRLAGQFGYDSKEVEEWKRRKSAEYGIPAVPTTNPNVPESVKTDSPQVLQARAAEAERVRLEQEAAARRKQEEAQALHRRQTEEMQQIQAAEDQKAQAQRDHGKSDIGSSVVRGWESFTDWVRGRRRPPPPPPPPADQPPPGRERSAPQFQTQQPGTGLTPPPLGGDPSRRFYRPLRPQMSPGLIPQDVAPAAPLAPAPADDGRRTGTKIQGGPPNQPRQSPYRSYDQPSGNTPTTIPRPDAVTTPQAPIDLSSPPTNAPYQQFPGGVMNPRRRNVVPGRGGYYRPGVR